MYKKFNLSALEALAKIIAENCTGPEITRLFERAKLPNIKHDGTTKWIFVFNAFKELQEGQFEQYGQFYVIQVIDALCDPQAYLGKNEDLYEIIEKIDEILAFYNLKINTSNGKVTKSDLIQPSLYSKVSEAEKLFKTRNFHQDVIKHAESLFVENRFFYAVFESCKAFENYVQEKSQLEKYGSSLMSTALSLKGPLKINAQSNETERNEQLGIMYLCMGVMQAIRNPTAHEPQLKLSMTKTDVLDILSLISFLWRKIDTAAYNKS